MNIADQLSKLGFSKGEAKSYLAALELGETTVARIAKKSDLERTTVYGHLADLKKRGLITISRKGKKTLYSAENPKRLCSELQEKEKFVESLLPELLSITNILDKKPKVRYFDNKEGIYNIYRETLEYTEQRITMWMSSPWYEDEDFWRKYYMPTRMERKISLRAIVPKNDETVSFAREDKMSLRETKMTESQNISSDIMLYGKSNIAIISYEEMTGLVIESKKLFDTLQVIFEAHWNSLGA